MYPLKYSFTNARGNTRVAVQKHRLYSGVRNPFTSLQNIHCNCNQWFPSNVIYIHPILTGSVVKEIGTEQPVDTNKGKKTSCGKEEVDFAWHAITEYVLIKTEDMIW